jgi:DNA-binding GntR family transcriptional regulator
MNTSVTLGPIQLPTVSDVVYEVLRKQILHGQLTPDRPLNLSQLESLLDVSRTPLKMALARLQNEGLVQIHPRRGTYVKQFTAVDIRECFELRIALEAQSLRYAFEPRNQALIKEIIALFREMDSYFHAEHSWLDENIAFMDLDRDAHLKVIQLSGNTRLQQAYEHANIQGYIAIMGAKFQYADVLKTKAEHRQILKALQAHNLPALLDAARLHLQRAGERALLRLTQRRA